MFDDDFSDDHEDCSDREMYRPDNPDPDVVVSHHGTLVLVRPVTDYAAQWIRDNVETEPWQWLGPSLAVDHRVAGDLLAGMRDAQLGIDLVP